MAPASLPIRCSVLALDSSESGKRAELANRLTSVGSLAVFDGPRPQPPAVLIRDEAWQNYLSVLDSWQRHSLAYAGALCDLVGSIAELLEAEPQASDAATLLEMAETGVRNLERRCAAEKPGTPWLQAPDTTWQLWRLQNDHHAALEEYRKCAAERLQQHTAS